MAIGVNMSSVGLILQGLLLLLLLQVRVSQFLMYKEAYLYTLACLSTLAIGVKMNSVGLILQGLLLLLLLQVRVSQFIM